MMVEVAEVEVVLKNLIKLEMVGNKSGIRNTNQPKKNKNENDNGNRNRKEIVYNSRNIEKEIVGIKKGIE